MSAGARCPISSERIDESSARVNGGITLCLLGVAAFTPARWVLVYLAIDFAIKVLVGFAYSPNCWIARHIAHLLGLEQNMIDAAPKRFAALIACFMSTMALVMFYGVGSLPLFYAFVGTFALFAFLECGVGFCMGCMIFGFLPERLAVAFARRGR